MRDGKTDVFADDERLNNLTHGIRIKWREEKEPVDRSFTDAVQRRS
jgi:hypothetical protein